MEQQQETYGIVYVLTNPAMPGLVKIGKTSRGSIDVRLNELYSTGVPVPFECAFAGKVEAAEQGGIERRTGSRDVGFENDFGGCR